MQIHFTPIVMAVAVCFVSSIDSFAQEPVTSTIDRLKYRYQINDVDGIGELISPMFQQMIDGDSTEFDIPQLHLVAMAAVKFHVQSGVHHRAIVPSLIATGLQAKMKEDAIAPLVTPLNDSFRVKHIPPVFFSEQHRQQFGAELDAAIEKGSLNQSELAITYRDANPNQLKTVQQEMLTAISAAKGNPTPSDRAVLQAVDAFVSHRDQHPTLAHESLATAIEALRRLDRSAEANRLLAIFRTQYPDSRRLDQ